MQYKLTLTVDVDLDRATEISEEEFDVDMGAAKLSDPEIEKCENILDETVHSVMTQNCDPPEIVAHALEHKINYELLANDS